MVIHTGFYKERDSLIRDLNDPNIDFSFMENEFVMFNKLGIYNFIHGYCDVMAEYMSNTYGYEKKYLVSNKALLVHAWCEYDYNGERMYIDARGSTNDINEMIEEFDCSSINDYLELGYEIVPEYYPGTISVNDSSYKAAKFFDKYYKLNALS